MKRLGTRLGIISGVIGLAVMAITQAQKDYSSRSQSLEFAELSEQLAPPAPIGTEAGNASNWPAPPDTQVIRGNDNSVTAIPSTAPVGGAASGAIRFASHQETVEGGAATPPPGFSMPAETTDVPSTAAQSPAQQNPAASAGPSFDLPSTLPSSGAGAGASTVGTGVEGDPTPSPPAGFQTPASAIPSIEAHTPAAPKPAPAIQMPDEAFSGFGNAPSPESSPSLPAAQMRVDQLPTIPTTGQANTSADVPPTPHDLIPSIPDAARQSAPSPLADESLTAPGFEFDATPAPQRPAAGVPAVTRPSVSLPAVSSRESLTPDINVAVAPNTSELAPQTIHPRAHAGVRSMDAGLVASEPGNRLLEGAQAPSVTIHKRAPEEVNVGKPATFAIQVRNTGSSEALNVVVHDAVPEGMELLEAVPQPQIQGNVMSWRLGDLEAGDERTITLQLLPHAEGELGSVARMSFQAAASVRTLSTRPELKIVQHAPEQVLVGQQVEVEIEVSNPGTGTAYGVILQEDVPEGMEHPKGKQLDNLLGNIEPGQSRRQRLVLNAVRPGVVNNFVQLISEDEVVAKNALPIEIVAPQLAVELEGPTRRFLERRANYTLKIANTGTAVATNIDVVAYLDRGLSFVSTEYKGQYDSARHAVFWSLAELPIAEVGEVPLVLLPIEPGKQIVRLETQADLGIDAKAEKPIMVDTLAEITFSVNDDQDPIEVGATTTYAIKVTNSGSREDSNVQLQVALPPGLEYVGADQQGQLDNRGIVTFGRLARMDARDEHTFRLRVRGRQEGTHLLKAIITSDQSRVPVTKEESTMVYSDQ